MSGVAYFKFLGFSTSIDPRIRPGPAPKFNGELLGNTSKVLSMRRRSFELFEPFNIRTALLGLDSASTFSGGSSPSSGDVRPAPLRRLLRDAKRPSGGDLLRAPLFFTSAVEFSEIDG